eukprot:15474253-Alexandrium_andersonii.AAC.1
MDPRWAPVCGGVRAFAGSPPQVTDARRLPRTPQSPSTPLQAGVLGRWQQGQTTSAWVARGVRS